MFDWLRQLWRHAQGNAAAAVLAQLEQQAAVAREQLNDALLWAHTARRPEAQLAHLARAKAQLAALQAIAAQHPRMHVQNEAEVMAAIAQLEQHFARAGYHVPATAPHAQQASVHVHLSAQSQALSQSGSPRAPH